MTTREELSDRLEPFWPENYYRGLDVGDGWLDLIDQLVTRLQEVGPMPQLVQIKEKFGGLRFYTNGCTPEQNNLIVDAERASFETCEDCGGIGTLRKIGGWYATLCDADEAKRVEARAKRWQ